MSDDEYRKAERVLQLHGAQVLQGYEAKVESDRQLALSVVVRLLETTDLGLADLDENDSWSAGNRAQSRGSRLATAVWAAIHGITEAGDAALKAKKRNLEWEAEAEAKKRKAEAEAALKTTEAEVAS